jgi:hypothetical protein
VERGRPRPQPPRRSGSALAADIVVHPTLVVTRTSGESILRQMSSGKPTKALRKLMRDGD